MSYAEEFMTPENTGAALFVLHPSGTRTRVEIDELPFIIGRHADNNLVLRDNRASRSTRASLPRTGPT